MGPTHVHTPRLEEEGEAAQQQQQQQQQQQGRSLARIAPSGVDLGRGRKRAYHVCSDGRPGTVERAACEALVHLPELRAQVLRMHTLALAALRRSPISARLRVWDVFAIGEARQLAATLAHLAACQNGHERAEDIALENQVLMNLVCG
jgi:hypothetical protein